MTIYAIFLCYNLAVSRCELQGAPRYSPIFHTVIPGEVFSTPEDCAERATLYAHQKANEAGRFYLAGNASMWFECRGKHVDTWEPVR